MEKSQVSNQGCKQQFQAILDAIDNHKGKKDGTEEWRQADAQLAEALNKFNFEFTLEQIKGILNNAEAARMILGGWFVSKICAKCKEILDKETAKNLLKHCKDLNGNNFNNFFKKVKIEDRGEIKEFHCEQQFQAIFDAINNYKVKRNDAEERWKAYLQFVKALNNFNFEFTLDQIKKILNNVEAAKMILGNHFVSVIWGKCPDGTLDKEAAEKLLKYGKNLNVDDFNKILNKVKPENREEIKKIREERFQAILDAINKYKNAVSLKKIAIEFGQALYNFNFKFTLKQIKAILNCARTVKLPLDSFFVLEILNKCPDEILDEEAALIFEDFGNKSDYPKTFYNYIFLSKCTSDVKEIVKKRQINKSRGIWSSIGVTFGVLFGLGAIGLGTAVGIGALAVTIAAPIAAAIAVVGLALISFSSYFVDKFRVNKVLNKIVEAKLNEKVVDKKEIPFDLRKRKEIQNALDEANKPLLGNEEIEIKE